MNRFETIFLGIFVARATRRVVIIFLATFGNNYCHGNTFSILLFLLGISWMLYPQNRGTDIYQIVRKCLLQRELGLISFSATSMTTQESCVPSLVFEVYL